jgi:hypothetical protein
LEHASLANNFPGKEFPLGNIFFVFDINFYDFFQRGFNRKKLLGTLPWPDSISRFYTYIHTCSPKKISVLLSEAQPKNALITPLPHNHEIRYFKATYIALRCA